MGRRSSVVVFQLSLHEKEKGQSVVAVAEPNRERLVQIRILFQFCRERVNVSITDIQTSSCAKKIGRFNFHGSDSKPQMTPQVLVAAP